MIQNGACRGREQGASGRSQCLGSAQSYWTGWMPKAPKHDPRTEDQSRSFFVKCGGTSLYPLNMAQEQHTPQNNSHAVYCKIKYAHLPIFRGFSSAPECNSQTVIYSCSKETDQPLLTEFSIQKVGYTATVYATSTKAMLFLHQLVLVCVYVREKVTASFTLGWEH